MNGLLTGGRIFFAMAMVFFGVQFFIFVSSTYGRRLEGRGAVIQSLG